MVILLFFCSGATALIYEVVWSKYLALMFGSTVQAQTVVLAVFMGGLALGNRLFGPLADRSSRPLAIYGYLEVAIGLYAFFFAGIYRLADTLYVTAGEQVVHQTGLLLLLKGLLSVALLLGPTVLMGGTLPLLASWLERQSSEGGRWSARFYSVNSLGAVAGSGLAGFFLVRWIGLGATLQMTALANVLIGFLAVSLDRRGRADQPRSVETRPAQELSSTQATSLRWAGALVAVTGGVSMGLEVLAARSLTLIFGASLQSFSIVLMAFILGIGLGSAVIASPRLRRLNPEATTVGLLITASTLLGFLVMQIESWVEIYRFLKIGLARNETGFRYHQLLTAAMSICVLGIPAALLGAVLPLSIRSLSAGQASLGTAVGRLLTYNTLGAVIGVLCTGFILMPWVGLRGAYGLLAAFLLLVALAVAWSKFWLRTVFAGGLTGAVLAALFVTSGESWRHVLGSGVFRSRETQVDPGALEARRNHIKLLFYEDAADATVSIEQGDGVAVRDDISLRINGKVDASSYGDLSTQYLLAHLPMMAKPDSQDIFLLGFGSGISAGALMGHPIRQLVLAENCEPVLRAGKFFAPWNRNVLANPLTRVWEEDARTVLKLLPQQYDIIMSAPSNPWMAGVGSVFSRQFYELAASRLKPGGLVAQWCHVYEMDDQIVSMVLRTFCSVFPYVEIWDAGPGDVILLGAKEPWDASPSTYRRVFERSEPCKDLAAIGLTSPELVLARQVASQRTAFAIPGPGPIQSDEFPILEYDAPKAFYIGGFSRWLFQFDERTWQTQLAPQRKRELLGSLDIQAQISVFGIYCPVNASLWSLLEQRFERATNPDAANLPHPADPMPCAIGSNSSGQFQRPVPRQASADLKALLQAEEQIEREPARLEACVTQIEQVLRRSFEVRRQNFQDWSPGYFAAVAGRAALGRGDLEGARSLLSLGFQSDPYYPQLFYLGRILERAESVKRIDPIAWK